jgi:MoaA/NifB/PqqE/SkfB family radical SAM enzyme
MTLRAEREPGVSIIQAESPWLGTDYSLSPRTMDINLTGACQLACDWCWGIPHDQRGPGKVKLWLELLDNVASEPEARRPKLLFTGGEPLMSPLLLPLLQAARERHIRTGLSTNAIAHNRLEQVLPFLDSIGVGIEGHTEKFQNAMRAGSERLNGFNRAIGGLVMAQRFGVPNITARSVADHINADSIPHIPHTLREAGVDVSGIRFKLYQKTPIGPRAIAVQPDGRARDPTWQQPVSIDNTLRIATNFHLVNPHLDLSVQLYGLSYNRYLQVEATGDAYTVGVNRHFLSYERRLGTVFDPDAYQRVIEAYGCAVMTQPPIIIRDQLDYWPRAYILDSTTIPRFRKHLRDPDLKMKDPIWEWYSGSNRPPGFKAMVDPDYRLAQIQGGLSASDW